MNKMALVIFVALALGFGVAQGQAVYKWVDAQGNVHYTDHPRPGAQKVQLPQTQTFAPPSMVGMPTMAPTVSTAVPKAGYAQFSLAAPADQANLWYVHEVTVSVNLSPDLRSGDTITYRLDGQTIGPTRDTGVTFKDVARGEHTASATLNAANGASMTAGPVTFYVHQHSILAPKPPL